MNKPMNIIRTAFLIGVILVAVGCSDFNAPTVSTPEQASVESFQYPPIETALATLEQKGYRALTYEAQSALDDQECDTITVSRVCRTVQISNINVSGICRLTVPGAVLPNDMTITVVAPSTCMGVANFYPHPTQFNGNVFIEWDVDLLDLPDDFDYNSIVPLYVHDDGTIEEVAYSWNNNHSRLTVQTNHFSRYIITQRVL